MLMGGQSGLSYVYACQLRTSEIRHNMRREALMSTLQNLDGHPPLNTKSHTA